MVRWYDWLAALLIADLILSTIVVAAISPIWYIQLVCGVFAWFVLDFWDNVYCKWRLNKENEY